MMRLPKMNTSKILMISLLMALFSVSGLNNLRASSDSDGEEKAAGGTDFIMHHITDAHEWHLITLGHTHVTIPLPVIIYDYEHGFKVHMSSEFVDADHNPIEVDGYMLEHGKLHSTNHAEFLDLSITKNVASLIISIVVLSLVFITVAKRYKKGVSAPKGIQSFFEPIIVFVRDDIAKTNIGHKYERFMPYLLTLFFFILFNNLLGLTPGAANLTGNIAVTMTLALITFIITNVNGKKAYWMHILWTPGVPLPVRPVILIVEIIGIFTKPISLMLRLFASITAGHIVVLSIVGLGFILQSVAVGVVGTLFSTVILIIEIVVALIQAYVFTLFSSMYIGQAVDDGHH
ncbi:F0F1 ATP synthase subunit A [Roseivirga sp.]|uniref:F0F1 ATP synthase subunit A n=1 Tax=Roseivirga sp. TaxID=1964215 RepID=UPI002B27544C|nr:F0F1 ATP synthase subunit A [Roseivirga sp.]